MNNKFIMCDTIQILNEIAKAKSLILNRNINDIWSAILLEIKNLKLTIKSTDRNIFFESTVPVLSEENFKILINATNFLDAIKALSFYKILKIALNENENKLEITGESDKGNENEIKDHLSEPTFSCEEIENYNYELNNEICDFKVELSQKKFKKIINKIAFSAHPDESKNVLNGVLFTKSEDSKLLLISTNGHRMSIYKTEITFSEKIDFIVPVKIFNFLRHIMSGEEGSIKIKTSDKRFYVEFDNYKVTCSLIDGNYPDYKNVIPDEQKNRSLIESMILRDRLTRVGSYVDKSKKLVLSFSKFQLKLIGEELITGRKGEFFVKDTNYAYDGSDDTLAINISYFIEAINVFEASKVELKFNPENVLKLSDPENPDFIHLIMPMTLN